MAALDLTSADAALKQLYKAINFQISSYERRPMMGSMPKDETFFGRNQPLVNNYAHPQGVSGSFTNAQSNATAAGFEDFLLTRVNEHSVAFIDGETLDAMSNDAGAFVTAMKAQVDGAMRALADRLESLIAGSATGALGRCASFTTDQLTLLERGDVNRFEVGMTLVASDGASAEGAALLDSGATEVVAGVNRRTGVLTATSAAWNTNITSLTASPTSGQEDYLYAQGDAKNNGTDKVTAGFAGWLPATPPSGGDSWFSVDRSTDSRLYGNYFDGSGSQVRTALIDGQSVASEQGGKVDTGFIHHIKYRQLCKEIDSQTMYTKSPARGRGGKIFAEVSYSGVTVHGDHGPITMLAANKMTAATAFLLEVATWVYSSIGPLTKFNNFDGNKILRVYNADQAEARLVSRANLGCRLPSYNVRVAL